MEIVRWVKAVQHCLDKMQEAADREDITGAIQAVEYMKRYDKGERTAILLEQLESLQ